MGHWILEFYPSSTPSLVNDPYALWVTVLPRKTLVDIVAGIFTGITTALQRVKDRLSATWDEIRSAGASIGKELLLLLLNSILDQIGMVMYMFSVLISTVTGVPISSEGSIISLGGSQLEVKLNDLFSLSVLVNGGKILNFYLPLIYPTVSIETLGLGQSLAYDQMQVLSVFEAGTAMMFTLLLDDGMTSRGDRFLLVLSALVYSIIAALMTESVGLSEGDKKEYYLRMAIYQLSAIFGIALSLEATSFYAGEFKKFVLKFIITVLGYMFSNLLGYLDPPEAGAGLEIAMWYFSSFFASLGIVLGVTGAKAVMSGGASLVTDALKMEEYENFMMMLIIMHFILGIVFLYLSGGIQ